MSLFLRKNWIDTWHVNPSSNKDYDFIDGLRGVAILMVVIGHYVYINPKSGLKMHFIYNIIDGATNGVLLFFALSGFLISWPFWKLKFSGSKVIIPPGYGWRRFWKIYPPLALSILMFTAAYIIFVKQDWSYVSLAVNWLLGIPFIFPTSLGLNLVLWSLVVEVHFYILLPLLFFAFQRLSGKACICVISLILLLLPPAYHLDFLAAGVLIAGLERMGMIKKYWVRWGVVGIVLLPLALLVHALLLMGLINKDVVEAIFNWMIKIASGCLLCFLADIRHPVAKLLCVPWLRWCGIVSYEWYLFHRPIVLEARSIFGSAGGSFIKFALIISGSFLLSLIISALVYRCFSLPILKYGRSRAVKK